MSKPHDPSQSLVPLVEVTVSAPAAEVWRALRDPAAIREWFGWDTDSLGDEIDFIFNQHAEADDAAHVLQFGRGDRFELVDHGASCVLRVVRPAPSADTDWDDVFDDETQGWIAFVQQLAFAFAHHRGAHRRTLYFSGSPRIAGGPSATRALGLAIDGLRPGDRHAVAAGTGEALAGTLWHRGRHQHAVTVAAWGDGLLLLLERPVSDGWPRGGSQAILTTYGLDDAAFASLSARWSAWWDANVGPSVRA